MADYNYKKPGVHPATLGDGTEIILTKAGNPHDLPVRDPYIKSLEKQGYLERVKTKKKKGKK